MNIETTAAFACFRGLYNLVSPLSLRNPESSILCAYIPVVLHFKSTEPGSAYYRSDNDSSDIENWLSVLCLQDVAFTLYHGQ